MKYEIHHLNPFGVMLKATDSNVRVHDIDLFVLRNLFLEHQLIVVRGFKTFSNANELSRYCDNWGEPSVWPFGTVLELVERESPEDHIFSNDHVPLHWDGMYRPQVPEYQIFHCVRAPLSNCGGRTLFSNTKKILETASNSELRLWKKVTGHYKRKMEYYDSHVVSPVVLKHPKRDFSVLRYNEITSKNMNLLNPPEQHFEGLSVEESLDFHSTLKNALYSSDYMYAHSWQDGDLLIADNFTLLHGREAFQSRSPRHLQRVQVHSSPPLNNEYLRQCK